MFLNWRFSIVCAFLVPLMVHSARFNTEVLVGIFIGVPTGVVAFYMLEILTAALFLLINELEGGFWKIKATLGWTAPPPINANFQIANSSHHWPTWKWIQCLLTPIDRDKSSATRLHWSPPLVDDLFAIHIDSNVKQLKTPHKKLHKRFAENVFGWILRHLSWPLESGRIF